MLSSRLLFSLCVSLAAALACGCAGNFPEPSASAKETPVVPVRAAPAEQRRMPLEIRAVGNVEAVTTIAVRARVSGQLVEAYVQGGETVAGGDPLFEIDPRTYRQSVRQWEAGLARSRADLARSDADLARARAQALLGRQQLERAETLVREGVWPAERLDQVRADAAAREAQVEAAEASLASAEAAIREAEANLESARLELSFCTIRSPIAGRVGHLTVQAGNHVQASLDELVTIRQTAPIYVSFAVPERQLPAVRRRVAQGVTPVAADVTGDSAPAAVGRLSFLENAVDDQTGTIRLRAVFDNAGDRLWPGQFVDVRLTLDERPDAVAVPAAALQTGQDGPFVYVVMPDGAVEVRPVRPDVESGGWVAVEGVAAGERVVTEGQLRVAPGMRVEAGS